MRQLSLAYSVSDCPFEIIPQCTGTRNGRINKVDACTMSLERAFLHSFTAQMMGVHNKIEIIEDVVHTSVLFGHVTGIIWQQDVKAQVYTVFCHS